MHTLRLQQLGTDATEETSIRFKTEDRKLIIYSIQYLHIAFLSLNKFRGQMVHNLYN